MVRAAIASGLILVAGFAGWVIGQQEPSKPWPMQVLVDQMLTAGERAYIIADSDSGRGLKQAMAGTDQPLEWLSHQLAAFLQFPDLTSQGFTLVERRLVSSNHPQAVEVIYATSSGRRLSLILRTRWQDETPQFRFAEKDGVTMVYWLEGPLAYALVGQLERQDMVDVVQTLRTSMPHQSQGAMLQIMPETAPPDTRVTPVTPTQPAPSKYQTFGQDNTSG